MAGGVRQRGGATARRVVSAGQKPDADAFLQPPLYANEFARGFEVAVSNDGVQWRTVATGTSTAQLTTVALHPTSARYLRITSTGTAGNWWTLADLRLYR